jgi:hypothetical protein
VFVGNGEGGWRSGDFGGKSLFPPILQGNNHLELSVSGRAVITDRNIPSYL